MKQKQMKRHQWQAAERQVASWLRKHGVKARNIGRQRKHWDVVTANGLRIEVKCASLRQVNSQSRAWLFNLHSHKGLNESQRDFYVLVCRCSRDVAQACAMRTGTEQPAPCVVFIVMPAPLGRKKVKFYQQSLFKKWWRYVNNWQWIADHEQWAQDRTFVPAGKQVTL